MYPPTAARGRPPPPTRAAATVDAQVAAGPIRLRLEQRPGHSVQLADPQAGVQEDDAVGDQAEAGVQLLILHRQVLGGLMEPELPLHGPGGGDDHPQGVRVDPLLQAG